MKSIPCLLLAAHVALLSSCASVAPPELVSAREAYRRASTGPASQSAPAQVHVANKALEQAERSFLDAPNSYLTRDLAYVAQRKAELAEADASIAAQQKTKATASSDFQSSQTQLVVSVKEDLAQSRTDLADSTRNELASREKAEAAKTAQAAAELRAKEAQAALARMAAVKDEPRGMVITLSGSVLFASNQDVLLPEARNRLAQVATVLLSTRERNIVVEGHTDSQGSDATNLALSQRRAEAVRNDLVQRGYQADRIRAVGLGESRPVADNSGPEGRANNRRVEIVIEHDKLTSSR
jgi:outer membrane protein OmpA-like peptidoglycan-associated protein